MSQISSYLKKIAEIVGFIDQDHNTLAYYYSRISKVKKETLLNNFLSGKETKINSDESEQITIYPFGFNISQKKAIDAAMLHQLSIIEGPPGTGKTQTILNIIANLLIRGKTIAVVSNNNSATQNVCDKLKKYAFDFFCASLGSRANKDKFIQNQPPLPNLSLWKIDAQPLQKLKKQLTKNALILNTKLEQQNQLYLLKQELSEIKLEEKHLQKDIQTDKISLSAQKLVENKIKKSAIALCLLLWYEKYTQRPKFLAKQFWALLMHFCFWDRSLRIFLQILKEPHTQEIIPIIQHKFYILKIRELEKDLGQLEKILVNFDFTTKMESYTQDSMRLFCADLAKRYQDRPRESYTDLDLYQKSQEFLQDYPLILSTTYSIRGCLSFDTIYDYVIIDEASQVDICSGGLALSCAKNVVIVGDLRQLPHVVDKKTALETDAIFEEYLPGEVYRYKNHSLLSSMIKLFSSAPRILLREHYRCHPKIIDFCNKKFYQNQLIIFTEDKGEDNVISIYKTSAGNHARNYMNQRQVDIILEEIFPSIKDLNCSIGIIAPYNNQIKALEKTFKNTAIKIATVDKFQGQENDLIIVSTVDNQISNFVDNPNRLNVAISRAVKKLFVIVNDDPSLKGTNLGDLISYAEYQHCIIKESKVRSIFDYLYKCYAEQRKKILQLKKRISEFDSENLVYHLILKILKDFPELAITPHVPIRMIIRDFSLLDEDEKSYISHYQTHTDFLIFRRIDKSPCLAIEVDGVGFHAEGTEQEKRDKMKNAILAKYDLPLLRLRTDQSGEEKRIRYALNNLDAILR